MPDFTFVVFVHCCLNFMIHSKLVVLAFGRYQILQSGYSFSPRMMQSIC